MSAACRTGYVNSPTDAPVGRPAGGLVLELGHAVASPKPAVHSSSQVSSACSGTWLCTKRVQTLGVEADRQQQGGAHASRRRSRPARGNGQRVQIDDAVVASRVSCSRTHWRNGAEVIAQVERVGGRLDAGEYAHVNPWARSLTGPRAWRSDDNLDPLELLQVGVPGGRHRAAERSHQVHRAVGHGGRAVQDLLHGADRATSTRAPRGSSGWLASLPQW